MARRDALLIGNSEFDDARLARLSAPSNDVIALDKALGAAEIGGFETTLLLNAGLDEVRAAIVRHFQNRVADDLLLFYYTGHGLRDEHGDLYLALPQTDTGAPQAASLDADFLRKRMNQSNSRRQVMILDCCHSGAVMDGAKRDAAEPMLNATDFNPKGHGRFVLAASASDESAFEADGRSIFTRHLVEGLGSGKAAPDKAEITILDLHTYASRRVAEGHAPMRPRLWVDELTEPLVIAHNANQRHPLPAGLVDLLWDKDAHRAHSAAIQLARIAKDTDTRLADDARDALRQRLEQDTDLPLLVARPIIAILEDTPGADSSAKLAELTAKLETAARAEAEATSAWTKDREALESQLETSRREAEETRNSASAGKPRLKWLVLWAISGVLLGSLVAYSIAMNMAQGARKNLEAAHAVELKKVKQQASLDLASMSAEADRAIEELSAKLAVAEANQADVRPVTPEDIALAQTILAQLGDNVGVADGVEGARTTAGLNAFRGRVGLSPADTLDHETLAALKGAVAFAPEPAREPFSTFTDCQACPEMVALPGDTFIMGSPDTEQGRGSDEGPQSEVMIAAFALARTEVTFDQWQACVTGGGCDDWTPPDENWGRGDRPVINVSWRDAKNYIEWLNSLVEGEPYRLPSEAEWEYAARSGTTTPFAFGETISTDQANYDGNYTYGAGSVGTYRQQTVPVSDLAAANDWGLRHMHGNVWEWIEDCWHSDYTDRPTDGSAWGQQNDGDCSYRVVRGGSWFSFPRYLRTADRNWVEPGNRSNDLGFRPARTLTP